MCVCVSMHAYMQKKGIFCSETSSTLFQGSLDVLGLSIYGSQSYLVLQVLRLLLLVVTTVDTPDKVMEVVLEELLTVGLTH